jgi:hypothetical protein
VPVDVAKGLGVIKGPVNGPVGGNKLPTSEEQLTLVMASMTSRK